jgi:hypothetical protein
MSEQTPESFTSDDTPDTQAAEEQSDGNATDPDRDPVSDAAVPDIPDEQLPEDLQPVDDNPLAQPADDDEEAGLSAPGVDQDPSGL